MNSFAPDGDVHNFGGNSVPTVSADIHGGVKGTNGINGADDEHPKSSRNAPPPKAIGPSYWRSNLESPVLFYSCRIFFQLLSHAKPSLRVLGIGAETGAGMWKDLTSEYGERMYSECNYTKVSVRFFLSAKERFKDHPNLQHAILDVGKDPVEQGFEIESCDLILASKVLQATPSMNSTLLNVRKLILPHGRLLLQELTPTLRLSNYIMGVLPSWWLGVEDGRPTRPYMSAERLEELLRDTGFSGTDSVIYDDNMLHQINDNSVSSHVETIFDPREVTHDGDHKTSPISYQVEAISTQRDFRGGLSTLGQMAPPA